MKKLKFILCLLVSLFALSQWAVAAESKASKDTAAYVCVSVDLDMQVLACDMTNDTLKVRPPLLEYMYLSVGGKLGSCEAGKAPLPIWTHGYDTLIERCYIRHKRPKMVFNASLLTKYLGYDTGHYARSRLRS